MFFLLRILFLSLCIMFELVFVFSRPLHNLLLFLCAHSLVLVLFSQTNFVKFIFALQCNNFRLQSI
jgi:hypothetical protein